MTYSGVAEGWCDAPNQRKGDRLDMGPSTTVDDQTDGPMTYVFDVKYKPFDLRYGVDRGDLFQLHTYAGQISNNNELGGCGFIFHFVRLVGTLIALRVRIGF